MRALCALAVLLAATNAYAAASASAAVSNRTATTITRADGSTSIIDGTTALLNPGDRMSYSFDYRLEVRDDGLPVSDETRRSFGGAFYDSSVITVFATGGRTGIRLDSFEIAFASIYIFPRRLPPPWEQLSGFGEVVATNSDGIAEHLVREGHGSVSFELLAGFGIEGQTFTLPQLQIDVAALSDPIPAVPEPATWAAMLAGLLGLAAARHASAIVRAAHAGRLPAAG